MRGSNSGMFRRMAQAEERMMRATMPRASEASPEPTWQAAAPAARERESVRLTFRMGDGRVTLVAAKGGAR